METYILSFRAPLRTLLQRQQIFDKLHLEFPQIGLISIDMDDKQFVMNIEASERIENNIQSSLLSYGYRLAFVNAKTKNNLNPKIKTA